MEFVTPLMVKRVASAIKKDNFPPSALIPRSRKRTAPEFDHLADGDELPLPAAKRRAPNPEIRIQRPGVHGSSGVLDRVRLDFSKFIGGDRAREIMSRMSGAHSTGTTGAEQTNSRINDLGYLPGTSSAYGARDMVLPGYLEDICDADDILEPCDEEASTPVAKLPTTSTPASLPPLFLADTASASGVQDAKTAPLPSSTPLASGGAAAFLPFTPTQSSTPVMEPTSGLIRIESTTTVSAINTATDVKSSRDGPATTSLALESAGAGGGAASTSASSITFAVPSQGPFASGPSGGPTAGVPESTRPATTPDEKGKGPAAAASGFLLGPKTDAAPMVPSATGTPLTGPTASQPQSEGKQVSPFTFTFGPAKELSGSTLPTSSQPVSPAASGISLALGQTATSSAAPSPFPNETAKAAKHPTSTASVVNPSPTTDLSVTKPSGTGTSEKPIIIQAPATSAALFTSSNTPAVSFSSAGGTKASASNLTAGFTFGGGTPPASSAPSFTFGAVTTTDTAPAVGAAGGNKSDPSGNGTPAVDQLSGPSSGFGFGVQSVPSTAATLKFGSSSSVTTKGGATNSNPPVLSAGAPATTTSTPGGSSTSFMFGDNKPSTGADQATVLTFGGNSAAQTSAVATTGTLSPSVAAPATASVFPFGSSATGVANNTTAAPPPMFGGFGNTGGGTSGMQPGSSTFTFGQSSSSSAPSGGFQLGASAPSSMSTAFGASVPDSTLGGGPASPAPGFKFSTSSTTTSWGAAGTTTGNNLFGGGSSGFSTFSENSKGSSFGLGSGALPGASPQPTQTTPAGASTFNFANSNTATTFGAPSQAAPTFGAPRPDQAPTFGTPPPVQGAPSFGSTVGQQGALAFGAPGPAQSSITFGANAQGQGASGFGTPTQPQPSPTFGAASPTQAAPTFGAAAPTTGSFGTPGAGAFGAPAFGGGTTPFGSQPANPFGSPAMAFGQGPSAAPTFGATPAAPTSPAFGSSTAFGAPPAPVAFGAPPTSSFAAGGGPTGGAVQAGRRKVQARRNRR